MKRRALRLLAAGPFSTLQDGGRMTFQRFGVSTAGALDRFYLAAANALVGNGPDEAAVEMTLLGDTYEVDADQVRLAVVGDFSIAIDGGPSRPFRAHTLSRGQKIQIGAGKTDVRAYLSVAGGFDVTPILGSCSTHTRSQLGGINGRILKAGDELALRRTGPIKGADLALEPASLMRAKADVRVVLGPQDDYFTRDAIETFLTQPYRISAQSDRMGYRLNGPKLAHAKGYNIVSDAIPLGAIQVPGSGEPIILLADRQTTGGYPKIACVITPDIGILAQAKAGAELRFKAIDSAAAAKAHRTWRQALAALPDQCQPALIDRPFASERLLSLNLIDGVVDMASSKSPH